MKTTYVSFFQAGTNAEGRRHYVALTKDGEVALNAFVHDSGHGAQMALNHLRSQGFEPSYAVWADKLRDAYLKELKGN